MTSTTASTLSTTIPTGDLLSPNSGSLREYDVICMNSNGFAIHCNITLSYG